MLNIVVLVSGGGTNLQALLDAKAAGQIPHGEFVRVISSAAGAYALERAKNAGAKFIVSPGFNPKVVSWCLENDIIPTPGCTSPTEIEQAFRFGFFTYSRQKEKLEKNVNDCEVECQIIGIKDDLDFLLRRIEERGYDTNQLYWVEQ